MKVGICDDDPMVRAYLAACLHGQPDLEMAWQATNGREAVEQDIADPVDVLVMDVRMPVMDGMTACAAVRRHTTPPAVLLLTSFDTQTLLQEALKCGAAGVLLKETARPGLLSAIRAVGDGVAVMTPKTLEGLSVQTSAEISAIRAALGSANTHEVAIARLLCTGMSNGQIAHQLHLAEPTVKWYVTTLMRRLGAKNRVAAAVALHTWANSPEA